MSVTFSVKGALYKTVEVDYGDGDIGYESVPADGFCDLNISNINAGAVLRMLKSYNEELVGEWKDEELSMMRTRIMLLKAAPQTLVTTTTVSDNFMMMGRSREYVERILDILLEVVNCAISNKTSVVYS